MTTKHPNLGLKAMLYIISYSQDENSTISDQAAELSNMIEAAVVNNEVPPKFRIRTQEMEDITDPSKYLDKIHRDKYKNEQLKILDILKTISVKLKAIDIKERNSVLKSKCRELNRWIIKDLRKWQIDHESLYEVKFHGIMIPLHEGDDRDPALITHIHTEMAKAFNTKARCPIMVVFETINLSEALKKKDELSEIADIAYLNFQKTYSDNKSTSKPKYMFELNQHNGDENIAEDFDVIVIEAEDCLCDKEEKKSLGNSSHANSDHIDHHKEHLKSFEQFAKFVEMEEQVFTEKSDNEEFKEGDSVRSAFFCFEYGNGILKRREGLMSKEGNKAVKRSRSEGDDIA